MIRKKRTPKHVELQAIQKKVSIQNDGLTFNGVLTQSNRDSTKATLLLVHGIRSKKEWWHSKSLILADQSYQTLAIDLRAHGESDGKYTTFGVKEKEDLSAWVNWYKQQSDYQGEPIGIWGQSLGGAVALQTMAVEDQIDFGIIESTFHDFETIAADYSKHYFNTNVQFATDNLLSRAAKLGDFQLEDARPVDAAKQISQPILFIHGSDDQRIKMSYNQKNFEAIPHSNKEFYIVEGGGHYDLWSIGGDEYRNKVFSFVEASTLNQKNLTSNGSNYFSQYLGLLNQLYVKFLFRF